MLYKGFLHQQKYAAVLIESSSGVITCQTRTPLAYVRSWRCFSQQFPSLDLDNPIPTLLSFQPLLCCQQGWRVCISLVLLLSQSWSL